MIVFLRSKLLLDNQSITKALKDAEIIGMDVYFVKSPFALLVDHDFPTKETFTLFDYGRSLIIKNDDKGADRKEVTIVLGIDFSMSCIYSLSNGIKVNELKLSKKNETLFDLNADGYFDMRVSLPPNKRTDILYKGKWQEVIPGDNNEWSKYKKKLKGGEIVFFDMQRGQWIPQSDNPDRPVNDRGRKGDTDFKGEKEQTDNSE